MADNKSVVTLYENSSQLLNASIDKITVEIINKKGSQEGAQVIVMTGCSPLAGTTSTSISLAIAMATTGRKTVLVDCDVRKYNEYKKLNEAVENGLADYISDKKGKPIQTDSIIYKTNVDNLWYVPCGKTEENPTRILCSGKMDTFLAELREKYDFVFLDFPSFSVVPDAQIMFSKADGIILIAALGETKKSQIKDARRLVSKYSDSYYGMIINKTPKEVFRANVKNSDYYLKNKEGKQHFENSKAYKKKLKGTV